ncbi:MAG: hypothetical protein R3E79_38740 [Caldilineaceae bacterium]
MNTKEFEVTKITLAPNPVQHFGNDATLIKVVGTISTNGKGTVKYLFIQSDNTNSLIQTIDFEEAGSKDVMTSWRIESNNALAYTGWVLLKVLFPTQMESEKAAFTISLEQGATSGSVEEPMSAFPFDKDLAEESEGARGAMQRIANTTPDVRTIWEFMADYATNPQRPRLLQQSFAIGRLASGCSGAMISPHLFMTAGHCGGAGWTSFVGFIRIDEDAANPGATAQTYDWYYARTLPWYESFDEVRPLGGGDTQLWWLEDGPDGIPPGIKYGYLELSPTPVRIGEQAYSFWTNPVENFLGNRLDWTTLFSRGSATNRFVSDWRGPTTTYSMYGAGGASGSPVLNTASGQVIGVTSAAFPAGGIFRDLADTDHFLRQSDPDRNNVLDAVEYDWVMTQPMEHFYHFWFNTPLRQALWMKNPLGGRGSFTTEAGPWTAKVEGSRVNEENDGLWHRTAKFSPNATYRVSVAARGSGIGQSSYIRFWSDPAGATSNRVFRFSPDTTWRRFTGRVTLGNHTNYRLVLGTNSTTTLYIQDLTIVREDNTSPSLDFETASNRAAWECIGGSYITAWGIRGANDFSGIVAAASPAPQGWGLRNRYLGFRPNQRYEITFKAKHISGPLNVESANLNIQNLGGASTLHRMWAFAAVGEERTMSYSFTIPNEMGYTLTFGSRGQVAYMVDDIYLSEVG